jgi:uncharacterized protein with NRDE domain
MCLILLAYRVHPEYPLVFAANRDEFFARPASPATFWPDAPDLLAGRDLLAGGTWMGITRAGRWAALTNFRDPQAPASAGRSRGALVAEYLRGGWDATGYAAEVADRIGEFDGFNLLVADGDALLYLGSRAPEPRELSPGVYGLSNHLLDTPWPKVRRGTQELRELVERGEALPTGTLFDILARTDPAPEAELPNTGVGREWERALSAAFIVSPTYGTRASTVLLVERGGVATFVERSFGPGPVEAGEVAHRFPLAG